MTAAHDAALKRALARKHRAQGNVAYANRLDGGYRYNPADNDKIAAFYASREWKLARYDTLRRDGPRCTCCGRTPQDGAVVNVDHIVSLRVDWSRRLDPKNLQVLCDDCNEGKGARHSDDWRAGGAR